ncbi:MAG: UDP-N-acetylmuramoyl-L-alanine--D-glutamate ligase [Bacteroidota bacterium]
MKVAVLGGGESGVGAAILAKQKLFDVWLSDKGQIRAKYKNVLSNFGIGYEEGRHTEAKLLDADVIIKSPGIPDHLQLIKGLKDEGKEIISEIEWGYRFSKAEMVAITGSNGKTTTTNLIYDVFSKSGRDTGLAGNIGFSLAKQVAEKDRSNYVIEVSSFQLDGIKQFKPRVAVLLNITPDHLDRYDYDIHAYATSKMRICMNQDEEDFFIYNADDPIINDLIKQKEIKAKMIPISIKKEVDEGAFLNGELLNIKLNNNSLIMSIYELALKGKHNVYNSMAAAVASRVLEIKNETVRESLVSFKGIEHRLEHVARVDGIDFINDSKATNINSVWYALDSVEGNIVWIVGGVDKGNDYSELMELVENKVKAIVCLGKDNAKIVDAFKDKVVNIHESDSAEEAVRLAKLVGNAGDTVLLSPACASFDLFENYEDRGHQFKAAVRSL